MREFFEFLTLQNDISGVFLTRFGTYILFSNWVKVDSGCKRPLFFIASGKYFSSTKINVLDPLERGWSLLFWASKIIKIEWLTRKLWCQTYNKAKSSTRIHNVFFSAAVHFPLPALGLHWISIDFLQKIVKNMYLCVKKDVMNPSWAFCLTVRLTSQLSRQSLDFNDFRCPEK